MEVVKLIAENDEFQLVGDGESYILYKKSPSDWNGCMEMVAGINKEYKSDKVINGLISLLEKRI